MSNQIAINNQAAPIINLRNLTKDYGGGRGVFGVTFSVNRGEVFGFLGPNGAGKTVTMRNLMGFVRPDSGSVTIDGEDCFRKRALIQEELGYLPGEIACMDEMRGIAFLEFMARMKNLQDRTRMHELIDYFQLDPSRKIRKMSKGTKQKVGLVCAFMARPDIVLLDEPTSGLDPLMQNKFINLILAEKARGCTILLSSHLFEEVERTCDRVAFIRDGTLVATERMDDVRRSRKRLFTITFNSPRECARYQANHPLANTCQHAPEITTHRQQSNSIETAISGEMDAFIKDLASYEVAELGTREQTLEELFMHLYGKDTPADSGEMSRPNNIAPSATTPTVSQAEASQAEGSHHE